MTDGVTWEAFHREWERLQERLEERDREQRERDQKQLDVLTEVRDSLGDMHTRFDRLECVSQKADVELLKRSVAELQRRGAAVRYLAAKLQPIVKPKLLLAAIALVATTMGWDWWPRIESLITRMR